MATNDDKGLFWNSNNGDRKYDAGSLGMWLSKFFTTGVFPGDFEVTATSGMGISVATGYANIGNPNALSPGGKVKYTTEAETFELATSDASSPRIDTVVIERNDNDREISIKVVTGTPSGTPVATAPTRTGAIYQLVIAEIYVGERVSSISDANITMKRADNSVCGIVTGTVTNNQIVIGTTELTPGVSELADGAVYLLIE